MARSLQQQLDDCDTAIAAIETGAQAYGTGLRRVDRGDLAALYKQRDALQVAVAREAAGGVFRVIQRDRPT